MKRFEGALTIMDLGFTWAFEGGHCVFVKVGWRGLCTALVGVESRALLASQ